VISVLFAFRGLLLLFGFHTGAPHFVYQKGADLEVFEIAVCSLRS